VTGLEDLAHAALTNPFEEHVAPQHQLLTAAGEQAVDLQGSGPLALEQGGSQAAQVVGKPRQQVAPQLLQLDRVKDPILAESLHQISDRLHDAAARSALVDGSLQGKGRPLVRRQPSFKHSSWNVSSFLRLDRLAFSVFSFWFIMPEDKDFIKQGAG